MIRAAFSFALFSAGSFFAWTRLEEPFTIAVPIALAGVCIAINALLQNARQ